MEDFLKNTKLVKTISIIALLIGLGCSISIFVKTESKNIADVFFLLLYVILLYYVVYGYSIPHGNLLRYCYFLYSVTMIFNIAFKPTTNMPMDIAFSLFTVSVAYISGRLNKYEKNKTLICIITIILVIGIISGIVFGEGKDLSTPLVIISQLISWACLNLSYFARYADHKEAGLEDK